jgi:hypothetical protein
LCGHLRGAEAVAFERGQQQLQSKVDHRIVVQPPLGVLRLAELRGEGREQAERAVQVAERRE